MEHACKVSKSVNAEPLNRYTLSNCGATDGAEWRRLRSADGSSTATEPPAESGDGHADEYAAIFHRSEVCEKYLW